jgi:hypothetical protein
MLVDTIDSILVRVARQAPPSKLFRMVGIDIPRNLCAVSRYRDSLLIRPKTARRERLWLEAVDLHYFTPQEIADAAGLSLRRVQFGLKRARGMRIDFQTVWDVEWVTTSNVFNCVNQCEWHNREEIPKGLARGCLACLRSGLDYLIRQPSTKELEHGVLEAPPEQEAPKEFAERMHGKAKPM